MGHSIGHWEGATLVVDTVGFNEGTWIDKEGHPHTSQLHVIEKLARTSINNLHIEATFDDPAAYTRPWTIAFDLAWGPDWAIKEYICQSNNQPLSGLLRQENKGGHRNRKCRRRVWSWSSGEGDVSW